LKSTILISNADTNNFDLMRGFGGFLAIVLWYLVRSYGKKWRDWRSLKGG